MAKVIEKCIRHEGERAIAKCSHCGKVICRKCQQEFGYFCSEECRAIKREETANPELEQLQAETHRMQANIGQYLRLMTHRLLPALGAILALYVIALCVSQKGKLQWRLESPSDEPFTASAVAKIESISEQKRRKF